jgi:hypothetical protein
MLVAVLMSSAVVVRADPPPQPPPTDSIRCVIWHDLPGAQITDTLATNDLDRPADATMSLDKLLFSPGFKDQWACSLSGMISVPVTGVYWFDIASRDSGALFLSSDENPANRKFIAETPAATDINKFRMYTAQTSPGIKLVAGQRYFIQAVCKSGPGPGGVSIGWTKPGGLFEAPIPAETGDLPPPSYQVHQLKLSLKPEATLDTQPGIHRFVRGAHIELDGQSEDMSYLMSFPTDFSKTTDPRALLIFLHGNNRQGYSLVEAEQTGPVHDMQRNPQLRDWMPMIVMCPQLPPGWRWDTPGAAQSVNALVEQLCQRYPRIDRRRIYITGLSMGGRGTWLTLENSPQTYAAAAPISAVDIRPDLAPMLLKDIRNLHIICGSEDGGFTAGSHRMYEALKPVLGDRVQLTVHEHEGHGVWDHYYPNKSFYEELLKFSK